MRRVMAALAAMLLCSCATPMPPPAAHEYGPRPRDFDASVREFLRGYLRDPMSAQITHVAGPNARWNRFMGQSYVGWGVCYRINARNAYGGYVGERLYYFIINNDRVVTEFHDDGGVGGVIATRSCAEMTPARR